MTYHDAPDTPRGHADAPDCAVLLTLQAAALPGLEVPVLACLRYHRDDPYAVYLDNHVDLAEPVTWVFGREILAAGLYGWAGTGDVSVFPEIVGDPDTVVIALSDDTTTALLKAPGLPIAAFLADTQQVVPYGAESAHLDIDQLVLQLLGDEGLPTV
ncbi:SsgA family sporulation/cell division regulator [Kitasatospora sp. MMS16-BH015]|uniref:SsgA family sporulation/cell division regulator n=1 Tax=Kitasatospora sp. MMS16-BH015 TaxID=2018025 RepID=UPI000CA0A725|nr:SsgA family sporulation/cell division regulator [Kitasatospora sp. MMS16-BH015]AUG75050.1 SsgA family sporulation/cell division regulator [Kitasatospora sp. MMS16-BH015]